VQTIVQRILITRSSDERSLTYDPTWMKNSNTRRSSTLESLQTMWEQPQIRIV